MPAAFLYSCCAVGGNVRTVVTIAVAPSLLRGWPLLARQPRECFTVAQREAEAGRSRLRLNPRYLPDETLVRGLTALA